MENTPPAGNGVNDFDPDEKERLENWRALQISLGLVPDELPVQVVREAHVHRLPPAAELVALVAVEAHPAPGTRILGYLPELLLVPRLEGDEPDAASLEGYVKRQPSPSSNASRMRRATTALCTSSGPS